MQKFSSSQPSVNYVARKQELTELDCIYAQYSNIVSQLHKN